MAGKKNLFAVMMGVAQGQIDKDSLADFLRKESIPL
jgi:hypothetical protein